MVKDKVKAKVNIWDKFKFKVQGKVLRKVKGKVNGNRKKITRFYRTMSYQMAL